ncbi:MAG: ankyrin repeat domain-containing protein [Nitrospirota bacterium]
MKTLKVLKAIVPMGGAGLIKALVLTMLFIGLLFLNSCANLIEAARKGDTAGVNALLNKGADVNAKDKYGWTALMLASKKGHTGIVQLLKKAGAKE